MSAANRRDSNRRIGGEVSRLISIPSSECRNGIHPPRLEASSVTVPARPAVPGSTFHSAMMVPITNLRSKRRLLGASSLLVQK